MITAKPTLEIVMHIELIDYLRLKMLFYVQHLTLDQC